MTRVHGRRTRRGAALLVVLWSVLVLATVAATASSAGRRSADVTASRRAGAVARAMAESGIVSGVARIDESLRAAGADSAARFTVLDSLEARHAARGLASDTLGDGAFAVAVIDVSARLDANEAGAEGWRTLLRLAGGRMAPDAIERLATAIDRRVRGDDDSADTLAARRAIRDSVAAAFLGRAATGTRRPFETVDALLEVEGMTPELLARLAPHLTVDGDGRVNRRAASPVVRAAAAGSLVDHPVRLLLVSRGWMPGHPLTREIEAVYDVADDGLRLVRWRERDQ